jgi:hypothetical protein
MRRRSENHKRKATTCSRSPEAIYLRRAQVTFYGGSGLDLRCLRLVTLRIRFSCNTTMSDNCPTDDPRRGYACMTIRLVG